MSYSLVIMVMIVMTLSDNDSDDTDLEDRKLWGSTGPQPSPPRSSYQLA